MGFQESFFFKMVKKFFSKASFTEGPKKTTSQRRLSPSRFWPDTSKKSGIGSCKEIKGQDGVGEVAYLGDGGDDDGDVKDCRRYLFMNYNYMN